jgi:mRNA-degrading endonuclease RelE of RelBE toxin-antitoxin system
MYGFQRTRTFINYCKSLKKKNQKLYERLKDKFYSILEEPFNNSKFLKGEFRGKRSNRTGDARFIFAVCKECRELGHTKFNSCANCDELLDETVVFFAAGKRENIY